ncbi:S24/S26 family peptidase [Collinsella tanakaei]|nr:S24/S26 family peptidase [Collinsella tanakaei]
MSDVASIPTEIAEALGASFSGRLFMATVEGDCMEPEIHDGETLVMEPMDGEPDNDLCVFRLNGSGFMLARLTAANAGTQVNALWGGKQMQIRRSNGACQIADARVVEIVGHVLWHGFAAGDVDS